MAHNRAVNAGSSVYEKPQPASAYRPAAINRALYVFLYFNNLSPYALFVIICVICRQMRKKRFCI